jgi:hypothetical protein
MSEVAVDTKSTSRFDFSRLFKILLRPREVFQSIAAEARPTWRTPMLAWSLTTILVVILGGYMKINAAQTGEVALPPDWQYWSPDMQDNYMQAQQTAQSPVLVYVLPLTGALIGLWLGWLILAGLLHLGSTLLGGRGAMSSALNVAAWAGVPLIVRDVLRTIFVLVAGRAIQSAGLSGFVTGVGMVAQLLARLDLFLIWNIILLVIGIQVADSLPKGKAIAGVLIVMFILLLAQAGMAALGANLGSAIQGTV